MFEGRRVVGFTFSGRKRYLEILLPYLLRDRHLIDRHFLCKHTVNVEDLQYIAHLCETYPDFFKAIDIGYAEGAHYHHFYKYFGDPDSVYLKFDDDICWVHPDATSELLKAHMADPRILVSFANTINNGVCSHLHQRMGLIETDIELPYDGHSVVRILDKRQLHYVADIHRSALRDIENGQIERWRSFREWRIFEEAFRVSINCICMRGEDIARVAETIWHEQNDEGTVSEVIPGLLKRQNTIVGTSLVSHFAFWPQRDYLEQETDCLARYKAVSEKL